ncbi:MAG: ABC transporter ATP-binding protein/permease [Spirochaetaceae bacterium]|jgi:ABC-type multidrug transport system fused ATPase/permease subunit|nr:ABC transporter ATP-binding protein/permease [Spirochaetaceae bacterium]
MKNEKQAPDAARGQRLRNVLRLIASMKPYSPEMAATILSTFLKHVGNIASAGLVAYMAALAMEGRLRERFGLLFGWLCVCLIVKALMYYGEMWFGHDVAYRVLKDFRVKLYDKVEEISPAFLLEKHSGQIGATLMGDVEILEWFLAHTFGSTVVAVLITLLLLGALGWIHGALSLLMLVFAVFVSATPFIFQKRADAQGREVREKLAHANGVTIEGIHGLRDLLTLNHLERYKEKNREAMQDLYRSQIGYSRRQGVETMLMQFCVGSFTVIVMGLAAVFVSRGRIPFSVYPVVVMLSALLFSPLIEVCGAARNLGLVFAAANRLQAVFDTQPAVQDEESAGDAGGPIQGSIEFERVSFRYRPELAPVLQEVSFGVKRGETVALVGPSGAGKSTCVNLLLRYWDPQSGSIRLDGLDIRRIPLKSLHDMGCAVLQEVYLFNISVRENIRLGSVDADDAAVIAAAKAAYAHEFILALPKGSDTVTGERGIRLSGGQRQRVAIARAILKNAPVLILDEAVANLDTESERYIRLALREQLAHRTILMVAHRLSTIMSADKLIVLNEGRVVQTGPHSTLINQEGFYRDLVSDQFDTAGVLK